MDSQLRREETIHCAGLDFGRHRHVCAFFASPAEEHRVLGPFVKDGIERGQKSVHIVGPESHAEYRTRLSELGLDVSAAGKGHQLEILNWSEAYLRGGRFDQHAMLALIEQVLHDGKSAGFPLTRLVAHMEWALEDCPGVDDIIEYETRLNYILPRYDDPVICAYDITRFSAGLVMDMLRTHPVVLIGGMLRENPFFVPPDQFLAELRSRCSSSALS